MSRRRTYIARSSTSHDRTPSVDPIQLNTVPSHGSSDNIWTSSPFTRERPDSQSAINRRDASQVSISVHARPMVDTSRPRQLQVARSQGSHPVSSSPLRSVDTFEDSGSVEGGDESKEDAIPPALLAWGSQRSRAGRGDLAAKGLSYCSNREIDLAVHLLVSAWVTAQFGLEWNPWPELAPLLLSDAIKSVWSLVQSSEKSQGFTSHRLEELVARKMRDSITEKRSLTCAAIREVTGNEYKVKASGMKCDADQKAFYKSLLDDHAVLSPDIKRPGYQKWLSPVIIKCVAIFWKTRKQYAQTQWAGVQDWWELTDVDKTPSLICYVSFLILLTIDELGNNRGQAVPVSSSKDQILYLRVKNSWMDMSLAKRTETVRIFSKKVHRCVLQNNKALAAGTIISAFNDTLDDLREDSDFEELDDLSSDVGDDLGLGFQNRDEDSEAGDSTGERDPNKTTRAPGNGNLIGTNIIGEPGIGGLDSGINISSAGEGDSLQLLHQDVLMRSNHMDGELPMTRKSVSTPPSNHPLQPTSEVVQLQLKGDARKRKLEKPAQPSPRKRRSTRRDAVTEVQLNWQDATDSEFSMTFKLQPDATWVRFCKLCRQTEDSTIFWTIDPKGRDAGGQAMCEEADLAKMLQKAVREKWGQVFIFDSSDQFPHEKE